MSMRITTEEGIGIINLKLRVRFLISIFRFLCQFEVFKFRVSFREIDYKYYLIQTNLHNDLILQTMIVSAICGKKHIRPYSKSKFELNSKKSRFYVCL